MSQSPLVAGVELGGTKCNCILATGPDDIRDEVRLPTTTPAETMAAIGAVLARWRGYDALGIASFGPVSIDRQAPDYGFITATTKPGWSNTDVAQYLAGVADVPTGFNSDVAGAALGEGRWGAAQDVADHAYITVGTGLGVGLVLDNAPVEGLTHAELGHIRPVRLPGDEWPGSCSFHGDCAEGLASGTAIRAQIIHTLVLTGIPRRVVMGGGVMTGIPHLFPRIRRKLLDSLGGYGATGLIEPVERFVVPAALGNRAGPLGAIELGNRALRGNSGA